ncbi:hypothetical protein [Aquabacterium sp. OR-4]|uniref:hypothetical protein n=1 Tax=Aquabacterium sp. OR-4 TaxID=2978127 RepID=UPI0028C56B75|nr:hypothetical protein [Aquabacterium sp. OR-4]MDT7838223.1 hypothetical protein [Aquabacterium sp. OR-4]
MPLNRHRPRPAEAATRTAPAASLPRHFVRSRMVEAVRRRLQARSYPRTQMGLIVLLTGGFGLLASFALLQFGLGSMALRYPLALACAYLVFLGLIGLWLRSQAEHWLDIVQLPDWPAAGPRQAGAPARPGFEPGGGGDFGGAGASASFDAPAGPGAEALALPGSDTEVLLPLRPVGKAASALAEADDLALPLAVLGVVAGLALASLYVVYIAPVLLAEVLVDGALSYALLRYLRGHDPQHWLASTCRRTALPFFITAVVLSASGAAMSAYAPGARSVGQVISQAWPAGASR